MNEFLTLFIQQLNATSYWEWLAVLLSIAYVVLVVKENSWCWPAAFVSTAIYTVLFFDVNLYMESALNIYYLLMAVYGWSQWRSKVMEGEDKPIVSWSGKFHLVIICTCLLLVFVTAISLEYFTDQDFAYIDSFTTLFAVVTTYMVTQKVLQNWLYWIVIDSVSIFLYLQKGFALTALLFVGYLIIAVVGWLKWKQHYYEQSYQKLVTA